MKDYSEILIGIFIGGLFASLIWMAFWVNKDASICKERGGIYVSDHCLKVEEIHV